MSALNQAVELFMAGRCEEARRACRKVVQDRPDLPEAHMLLAEIERALGEEARAKDSDTRVLRLRPAWTPAHALLALGDLYSDFGRPEDAEARYRSALAMQPDFADARFNLAGLLHGTGRAGEAIAEQQTLLAQRPDAEDARERLARLLFQERRFDELQAVCVDGMQRFPRAFLYPERLATIAWFGGRHEEALRGFALAVERASTLEARQDASLSQAIALLGFGRYQQGWEAFHRRHARARVLVEHPEIVEDPAALAALAKPAHIRILGEQGLGDEIFFLRFAAALRERGHRLSFVGDARLAAILPGFFEAPAGSADYTVCSGDLPLASGQEFALPLALPVEQARRARMKGVLREFGPPPYVGVTWRAGLLPEDPKPQRGAYLVKEVPPDALARAIAPSGARVVILQRKPSPSDLQRFKAALGRPALDLSAANDDLRDVLALLAVLDEYIGVSNTNMHLRAGLQGMPARVLESMPPEWRWGLAGRRSPWFPDFMVYRRQYGDGWATVLQELRQDLLKSYAAPHHR